VQCYVNKIYSGVKQLTKKLHKTVHGNASPLSKLIMFKVEIIRVSKNNLLSLTFMHLLKFYSKKIRSSSPHMWCWQWSVHYPVPTDQNARAFGTASHTVASIWFVRMKSNWQAPGRIYLITNVCQINQLWKHLIRFT
jgi:hypothetical protein